MLTFKQVKNNARSTTTGLNNVTDPVTFSVTAGHGARFPQPGNSFWVTVWDAVTYADPGDDPNMEIMLVTARSTDSLTATRAQLGTTAVTHVSGAAVRLLIEDQTINDIQQAILDDKVASWMDL